MGATRNSIQPAQTVRHDQQTNSSTEFLYLPPPVPNTVIPVGLPGRLLNKFSLNTA